jgi:hypothetical protein
MASLDLHKNKMSLALEDQVDLVTSDVQIPRDYRKPHFGVADGYGILTKPSDDLTAGFVVEILTHGYPRSKNE